MGTACCGVDPTGTPYVPGVRFCDNAAGHAPVASLGPGRQSAAALSFSASLAFRGMEACSGGKAVSAGSTGGRAAGVWCPLQQSEGGR